MEKLLTSKEMAEAIGASESSLRRWTNSGVIVTSRTVGGHRRIPLSEAIRFIRETKATVVRPDLLGLTHGVNDPTFRTEPEGAETIHQGLLDGNGDRVKGKLLATYLGGTALATIFDTMVQPAMKRIGELWQHDAAGILVEHRALDICLSAVNQLRGLLPPAPAGAPVAIGGAPQGDRYILPSLMAATVLADAGCLDVNFGADTPVEILGNAAAEHKASFVWLSISAIEFKTPLQRDVEKLADQLRANNTRLLIGGRLAGELTLRRQENVHLLGSMTELAAFARGYADRLSRAGGSDH